MSKYKVGDKVRIVSEWGKGCRQNSDGKMDKWLGKTMTIRKITAYDYYLMEEDKTERDGIGWCWFDACIAGLANKFNDNTKKIVITTDGKTTTAKMYDGKSCIKVSEARCCPSDAFDFQTGAKIAFNRLFGEPKNEFDWDAFKSHKLAVAVTRETIKSFLSEAENHGCVWISGLKPTKWNPAEEYELEKTYLYGIKNTDIFGTFGWRTVRPYERINVIEW
jgi:hypothetical protein